MRDQDARLTIPAHVVTRRVGEETVILDLDSGTYFGLDPVGARFLELLESRGTIAAVMAPMLEEFEVGEEQLAADLDRLAAEMLSAGLLSRG